MGGFRQSMFSDDRGVSAGQSRGQFRGDSALDGSFEEEPHLCNDEPIKRSSLLNEDGTDLTVEQFRNMASNLKDEGPGAMKIKGFGWLKTSLN